MIFSELFDETLDINSTANYRLSIQANLDGFYFCVSDCIRNKHILYRAYEPGEEKEFDVEDIASICLEDDFLRRSYGSTGILVCSPGSTLVPRSLYDPAGRDDYFLLGNKLADNECIKLNRLRQPDACLIFSMNSRLDELLTGLFPGIEITHHLKPLLHHLHQLYGGTRDDLIHLHIEKDFFSIVHFSKGEMKLCNTFKYRSTSDLLYYLLYSVRQLSPDSGWHLAISGISVMYDEVWSELAMYVANLRYALPDSGTFFSHVFSREIQHRHLNLFTFASCG